MVQRATNIRDIARRLKVTPGTVSRALNHAPGVGEKLRREILQLADELDYRVKPFRSKRTDTIGLLIGTAHTGVIENDVAVLAIGAGVVADPRKFIWEGVPLEKRGYRIFDRLLIDERTMLSDVGHRLLDLAWEDYRVNVLKEEPRGSTGRGITPSYADEVGQFQICYCMFQGEKKDFDNKVLEKKIANKPVPLYKYKKLAPSAEVQKKGIEIVLE